MKLIWVNLFIIMVLFSSLKSYGYRWSGEPECISLTKEHLHAILENPKSPTIVGKYKLSLKTPCTTSCGEDCIVLLHGYEEALLINPVDDEFDNYGTCVYHLGANDHIHVAIEKIK